jgi:hypothetical protein
MRDNEDTMVHNAAAFNVSCFDSGDPSRCTNLLRQRGIPSITRMVPLIEEALTNINVKNVCMAAIFKHVTVKPFIVTVPCNKIAFASYSCVGKDRLLPFFDRHIAQIRNEFQPYIFNNQMMLLRPTSFCLTGWSYSHDNKSCFHLLRIDQSVIFSFGIQLYKDVCKKYQLLPHAINLQKPLLLQNG